MATHFMTVVGTIGALEYGAMAGVYWGLQTTSDPKYRVCGPRPLLWALNGSVGLSAIYVGAGTHAALYTAVLFGTTTCATRAAYPKYIRPHLETFLSNRLPKKPE